MAPGRERLKAEVAALVEGALRSSAPGRAFTRSVMAALPVSAVSAKFAVSGALAGKAIVATVGPPGAMAGGLLGFLGGYLSFHRTLVHARTEEERRIMRAIVRTNVFGFVVVFIGVVIFILFSRQGQLTTWLEAVFTPGLLTLYAAFATIVIVKGTRKLAVLAQSGGIPGAWPTFEYCSKTAIFGLPLIHVRFGWEPGKLNQTTKGWIAIGGMAYGGLFAAGGVAIAPVAIGGLAVGGISVGGAH